MWGHCRCLFYVRLCMAKTQPGATGAWLKRNRRMAEAQPGHG
jgi:hypothetical protein